MSQPYSTPPGDQPTSANPYEWAPAGAPPTAPGYAYPAPYGHAYPAPVARNNGLAIASMVVSIAAFAVCGGLLGIVGAILGHVARRQIREQGGEGDGMALAGIIVGWIGFAIGLALVAFYIFFIVAVLRRDGGSGNYGDYGDMLATLLAMRPARI
jgi:hypothetical protein